MVYKQTPEQQREHYLLEKKLADRLKNAAPEKRLGLYTEVYNILFQSLPHHPQNYEKTHPELQKQKGKQKLRLVGRFLSKQKIFLEIGCGDGGFSRLVKDKVQKVYAVDVSDVITDDLRNSKKIQFVHTNGTSIPLPNESVDVVYSNQLMEHLHPDDAMVQLREILRVLTAGGCYVCITPNAFSGPHDISKFFSDIPEGFHLKEYTWREILEQFQQAGFSRFAVYAGGLGWYVRIPQTLLTLVEVFLSLFPRKINRHIARFLPLRAILGLNIVAYKG